VEAVKTAVAAVAAAVVEKVEKVGVALEVVAAGTAEVEVALAMAVVAPSVVATQVAARTKQGLTTASPER